MLRHRLPLLSFLSLAAATAAGAQRPTPQPLDTVIVSASRTTTLGRLSRSIDVITRDDIAGSPARTVADLLSSVMGVDVYSRSAAQADLSIRGSTSDQILVLVDGVRVSDVQSSHYALDLAVPLESIERIEILRGSASAIYGANAVGGLVNIVTRHNAFARSSAELHGGSFGAVGGALSGATSGLNVSADFDKSDGHRDGTDYRMGQGRVGYATAVRTGELTLDAGVGIRDFGAADFYAPYNSIERTASTTAASRWLGRASAWTLDLSAETRRHQDHYVLIRGNPSVYENHHESWQSSVSGTARHTIGSATAALGGDAEHDQLSSLRLGGRREWRGGLFAELSGGERLNWNLGARGDHSSAFGDYVSPSASAGFDATSALRLHASAGSGFRAPTWTERFYSDPSNAGNPDLAVERFANADAGATLRGAPGSIDVTTFGRRAHDLIDWTRPAGSPTTSVWRASNIGDATIRGFEASLESRTVNGVRAAVFATGLTLSASEGQSVVGKYALRPVTRQLGGRLSSDASRAISARVEVLSARRANEDGYTTGNVRLALKHSSYRLTLDATNLANAVWLDASGKPSAPRAVYAGMALTSP